MRSLSELICLFGLQREKTNQRRRWFKVRRSGRRAREPFSHFWGQVYPSPPQLFHISTLRVAGGVNQARHHSLCPSLLNLLPLSTQVLRQAITATMAPVYSGDLLGWSGRLSDEMRLCSTQNQFEQVKGCKSEPTGPGSGVFWPFTCPWLAAHVFPLPVSYQSSCFRMSFFFCLQLISLYIMSLVFLPLSSPLQWNTVTPISGFPRHSNTAVWLSHFPAIEHPACQHFHLVLPTVTLSPFQLVASFQSSPPPPLFTLPTSVTHCTRGWQHQR